MGRDFDLLGAPKKFVGRPNGFLDETRELNVASLRPLTFLKYGD